MARHLADNDYGVWMCGGGRTGPDVLIIGWRGEVEEDPAKWVVDEGGVGFSEDYLLRPIPPDKVIGVMMAARMSGGFEGWRRVAAHIWSTLDPGERG